MFEREIMIAGLRKEHNTIRELIEELENSPSLESRELTYCRDVIRRIESTLKRLRRP